MAVIAAIYVANLLGGFGLTFAPSWRHVLSRHPVVLQTAGARAARPAPLPATRSAAPAQGAAPPLKPAGAQASIEQHSSVPVATPPESQDASASASDPGGTAPSGQAGPASGAARGASPPSPSGSQASAAAPGAAGVRQGAAAAQPFGFASVIQLAQQRAAQPYRNRSPALPDRLAHLTYDQYQSIRFRPHFALWRNQSLFEVQFFQRGFTFNRRVEIAEVVDGVVHPIRYNPVWFDFGKMTDLARHIPAGLGFAGFRVHYPLQTPTYKDELIAFLGASYFRVLGRNEVYGLSARGLAIDTASTSGEEFPWFTDFWLVKPSQPEQRTLTIYALLDSPSIAGAYQFVILPGTVTQVTVTSELFPRKHIAKLGVAPLTSMFLYGEDPSGHRFKDFRPEVHDSDGLMMQTGSGEWLWRPLENPADLAVNRFMDQHPRGFGLSQRDRTFSHYMDSRSQFERRPSYWVQPLGDWGKGGVELVEIPTDEEIHDNIVAYWVPSRPVDRGKPLRFDYVLSAYLDSPLWPPGGRAIATRTGAFAIGGEKPGDGSQGVMIDFAGGDLDGLDGTQPLKANVSANGGSVDRIVIQRIPQTGHWRVTFRVVPATPKQPVDLKCYLTLYGEALSETWIYQLPT
ncbi:MAG: glucan biosynthesis protein [Steroidobacteraceae bacterium]